MAEAKRDIRAGAVSRTLLEQSQMDLSGLRIGKQRLVAKKKKSSKLKKLILEDREYRTEEGQQPQGLQASKYLSADAPSFVPTSWFQSTDVKLTEFQPPVSPSKKQQPLPVGTVPRNPPPVEVASFMPSWCSPPVHAASSSTSTPGGEKRSEDAPNAIQQMEEINGPLLTVGEAVERLRAMPQFDTRKVEDPEERKKQKAMNGKTDIEVRHYVHQELSDELDERVKFILSELARFQERAKEQSELKYAKLKRYCVGLRESKRAITRNRCKGLIIAPNLEESNVEGGLGDTVEDLIELARDNEVPVIFALSRNRIGKALGKNIRLSIVALHSVDGVHQQFKEVMKLTEELRKRWVLRQMAHATGEYAEEAQRRAEEKAAADARRREEKARLAEEKAAEDERRRVEARAAKAARAEEKARRVAEQKEAAVLRRAEKTAKTKELEEEQETATLQQEAERRAAEEERRKQEQLKAKEADLLRREAQRKAQEEAQRRYEAAAAAAASGASKDQADDTAADDASDADSDSSEDLPLAFNAQLF